MDGSVIGTADPQRDYKAFMLVLNRAFRYRWGFQGSYVLAKAEGNVENGTSDSENTLTSWLSGTTWNSPNTALINKIGELVTSRRHEIKLYANYQIPKVEVMLAGIYTGLDGRPYTPYQQYGLDDLELPQSDRRRIFLEPRGSR